MSKERQHGYLITASSTNNIIPSNTPSDFKVIFKDPVKIPRMSKFKLVNNYVVYGTTYPTTSPGVSIKCLELTSLDTIDGTTGQKNTGIIYNTCGKILSNSTDPNNAPPTSNTITSRQRTIYDTYEYPAVNINNKNELVLGQLTFKVTLIDGTKIPTNPNQLIATNLSFYIGNDI